jgi:O-antigen biosynthesis protein
MISVIIPTYKEPEYLDLCLKSAFEGQTNKNEIIVVVDGFYELNKPILDKYPDVRVLDLGENQGLSVATNWGVYNATHEYILVVNDDNVFPKDWDSRLEIFCQQGVVVSPNQIEPNPSMFHQFIIKDLGKTPEDFNLEAYWEFEQDQYKQAELNGSTLPFLMNKYDYLAVGGWDVMYPSPHVVDWDFFLKCEYVGYLMKRVYVNFYHFAGAATRKTREQSDESTRKEQLAHEFFATKWDSRAEHHHLDNSKLLRKFKQN